MCLCATSCAARPFRRGRAELEARAHTEATGAVGMRSGWVMLVHPGMPLPFSTGDPSDVQAEDGQGADDDHPGGNVDPLSKERGKDDRECSGPEIQCNSTTTLATTMWAVRPIVKTMRFNAPPFGRARPPPPQTPKRSAFQRGWVGGRSEPTL